MSEWRKVEIAELCTAIIDCVNKTAPISEKPTKYKMLRTSDIRDGFINLDGLNSVTEQVFEKWTRRGKLQKGDIIFTREAPLGEAGIVRDPENYFLGQRLVLFRADPKVCDAKYLLYWFLNRENKQAIISRGVGATVLHLRVPVCEKIEVSVPDIGTQHRIGEILSQYDDLIENSQKQIKLLEEVAQRLYKEWFVDLHFPGYEDVKVVNGVPEGWMLISLDESISYEIGGGWGEEIPTAKCDKEGFVIRGTDFYGITHGDYKVPFRYHSASNLNSRMLVDGDIIFEVSGGSKTEGVARTAYITQKMLDRWNKPVMCASFCKLVRSKDSTLSLYLFNHLQYLRACGKTTEYDKKSASSIVNYRWKDFLSQECILIPSADVLAAYNSLVKPLQDSIVNCSLEIEKASIIRDTLLPKLMSGEIEV